MNLQVRRAPSPLGRASSTMTNPTANMAHHGQVNGQYKIHGAYAHHAERPSFKRRTYHLIEKNGLHELHLVHYLDWVENSTMARNRAGTDGHVKRASTRAPPAMGNTLQNSGMRNASDTQETDQMIDQLIETMDDDGAQSAHEKIDDPEFMSFLETMVLAPFPLPTRRARSSAASVSGQDMTDSPRGVLAQPGETLQTAQPQIQPHLPRAGPQNQQQYAAVTREGAAPPQPSMPSPHPFVKVEEPPPQQPQAYHYFQQPQQPQYGQQHMPQPAQQPTQQPPQQQVLVVEEFSPEWSHQSGGGKIMIMLSGKVPPVAPNQQLKCGFGDGLNGSVWVEASCIGDQVLKCLVPPHDPGLCRLTIAIDMSAAGLNHILALSPPSAAAFTYRGSGKAVSSNSLGDEASASSIGPMAAAAGGGKRRHENSMNFSAVAAAVTAAASPPMASASPMAPMAPPAQALGATLGAGVAAGSVDRENKRRLYHKMYRLDTMIAGGAATDAAGGGGGGWNSSLAHEPMQGRDRRETESSEEEEENLLDDVALSKLDDSLLEGELDKLLISVVKQMAQLAATDQELLAELNALDRNGYGLLHYACLYNLSPLIPVLLGNGAQINSATGDAQTPLHLAAMAGHLDLVDMLTLN